MLKYKIYWLLYGFKMLFCNCSPEVKQHGFKRAKTHYQIQKVAQLPPVLNEASGLVLQSAKQTLLGLNDGGGRPTLYESDWQGRLLDSLELANATNVDWEDLTQDTSANLYVGDFGNNANKRKDLTIYKLNHSAEPLGRDVQAIRFRYATQGAFPPSNLIYDCEAFFWYRDSLYLFSKNRGQDRAVRLYQLPAIPGNYVMQASDSLSISTQATGAAISPNGQRFALLTYGKVFVFGVTKGQINFRSPLFCIKMARKQTEAISFLNDDELLITNEQRDVYRLRRKN